MLTPEQAAVFSLVEHSLIHLKNRCFDNGYKIASIDRFVIWISHDGSVGEPIPYTKISSIIETSEQPTRELAEYIEKNI